MPATEVEISRVVRLPELARELLRAARAWAMYPATHPAASASIDRLHELLSELTADTRLRVGITPHHLTLDDQEPEAPNPIVAEAAKLLHGRDLLQLTFETHVSKAELRALIGLLKSDVATLRERGGPARVWRAIDSPTIRVEQLDYRKVMERTGSAESTVNRDDRWKAIVKCMLERRTLDAASQQQVLEISHDADALEALVEDVQAPMRSADGSPIVTAQAAAVLNAYRQISEIVAVRAPDAEATVLRTAADVSQRLSPAVMAEMIRLDDDLRDDGGSRIGSRLVATMDEASLGGLLADVATQNQASTDRLGRIINLLDDSERKQAVLAETRTALSRKLQDEPERLQDIWSSIEHLSSASDATKYTPTAYGAQLAHAAERAHSMLGDLPPQLEGWLETIRSDQIRQLTLTLLTDLLALDPTDEQADAIVGDLGEAAEDLLAAGDYAAVLSVVERLTATRDGRTRGHRAAAGALQRLATGTALEEASMLLDAMSVEGYERFRRICVALGPTAVDALRQCLTVPRPESTRLVEILRALGEESIARLAPLVHHPDPQTSVRLARLLGLMASAECLPLLENLARSGHQPVSVEATHSLLMIGDPRSAKLVTQILRTSSPTHRSTILAGIATGLAPECGPLLVQVLSDFEPLGEDHELTLQLLDSFRELRDPRLLSGITRLTRRRSWLRPRRTRALRQRAIETLLALPGSSGGQAVSQIALTGDRQLRRLARAALRSVTATGPGVLGGRM